MSDLIPEIVVESFKLKATDELRKMACCEVVTKNGDYIGTWVAPQTDYVKVQVEYLGQLSNSVIPQEEPEPEPEPEEEAVEEEVTEEAVEEEVTEAEGEEEVSEIDGERFYCSFPGCDKSFGSKIALIGHTRSHKAN